MAGRPSECARLSEPARQRSARRRVDVGTRAQRSRCANRRRGARAASPRAHRRTDGHSHRPAAQHHPRGLGARHCHPRGPTRVTSLSLNARPLPTPPPPPPPPPPPLRPPVLSLVSEMAELMALFLTTASPPPASNLELCL